MTCDNENCDLILCQCECHIPDKEHITKNFRKNDSIDSENKSIPLKTNIKKKQSNLKRHNSSMSEDKSKSGVDFSQVGEAQFVNIPVAVAQEEEINFKNQSSIPEKKEIKASISLHSSASDDEPETKSKQIESVTKTKQNENNKDSEYITKSLLRNSSSLKRLSVSRENKETPLDDIFENKSKKKLSLIDKAQIQRESLITPKEERDVLKRRRESKYSQMLSSEIDREAEDKLKKTLKEYTKDFTQSDLKKDFRLSVYAFSKINIYYN